MGHWGGHGAWPRGVTWCGVPADPPYISNAKNTGASVGQKGILQCEASAVPVAEFQWFKEDTRCGGTAGAKRGKGGRGTSTEGRGPSTKGVLGSRVSRDGGHRLGRGWIWPGHPGEEGGLGLGQEGCFWHGEVKGWLLWGWMGCEGTWWWARRALFSSCPTWGSEQCRPPLPAG